MTRCPICRTEEKLVRFEAALDKDGNATDIMQCRSCLVLLNGRAHRLLEEKEIIDIQLTDYYLPSNLSPTDALTMVREKASILEYLYNKLDRNWSAMNFCDFGGGTGQIALAAASKFKSSYICEFDTRSVQQLCGLIGKPKNMHIVTSLEDIDQSIDVLFMWHVLEHIPCPVDFLDDILPRLSDNCIIFLQCPGYRPEAIVDCHYTFFNEPSMRLLFEKSGIKKIEISFDIHNGFVGYLGQR